MDYYDIFYFETRVRDMMQNFMKPIQQTMKDDKKASIQLRFDYDNILERMHELESYCLIQEWKLDPSKAW